MARNRRFHLRRPLAGHPDLRLDPKQVRGPFSFLNPTQAAFQHVPASNDRTGNPVLDPQETPGDGLRKSNHHVDDVGGISRNPTASAPVNGDSPPLHNAKDPLRVSSRVNFKWRSRDNRKGRHALVIEPLPDQQAAPHLLYLTPAETASLRGTAKGIQRMFTQFPYWDISYLVAILFTLGSVVWVLNAFFAWLPLVRPSSEFHNESLYAGGITAFVGATIFELGSVLLMIEAVNENREGCFGWALQETFATHAAHAENTNESSVHGNGTTSTDRPMLSITKKEAVHTVELKVEPSKDRCQHHHSNPKNFVGKGHGNASASPVFSEDGTAIVDMTKDKNEALLEQAQKSGRAWQWFPSRYDLINHYLREMGFLAALFQLVGASVFWISGFTALPGINNKLSQGALDGIFWAPQIIGGTGFIVSGTLYMLETQDIWYRPAFQVLGWHIGFWNLIGAIGFTLCGALGPASSNSGVAYQSSLATFWGSVFFLGGSIIQWYESLDKHPVEIASKSDPLKS